MKATTVEHASDSLITAPSPSNAVSELQAVNTTPDLTWIKQILATDVSVVPYATIDRLGDGTVRVIFVSEPTRAAIRQGDPLPSETVFVMEAYRARRDANGALVRDAAGRLVPEELDGVFVRAQLDDAAWPDSGVVPEGIRNGAWDYVTIDPDTRAVGSVNNLACHACHLQAEEWEYTLTQPKLLRWGETGEMQHGECALVGRQPCEIP